VIAKEILFYTILKLSQQLTNWEIFAFRIRLCTRPLSAILIQNYDMITSDFG
jgi:hypothetical protein